MALTKATLAEAFSNQNGLPKKASIKALETIVDITRDTLASGEDALISGFGKFEVREKNARRGRNPATGGDLMLPARKVVTFKVSGRLRKSVNSSLVFV